MSEQPLLADLFGMPSAGDAGLLCTNLRTLDGRRPVFIDHSDSTFFFPYLHVRFLEWTAAADDGMGPTSPPSGAFDAGSPGRDPRAHRASDDDGTYLTPPPGSLLPAVVGGADDGTGPDEIELDEDFLRRIRDV